MLSAAADGDTLLELDYEASPTLAQGVKRMRLIHFNQICTAAKVWLLMLLS